MKLTLVVTFVIQYMGSITHWRTTKWYSFVQWCVHGSENMLHLKHTMTNWTKDSLKQMLQPIWSQKLWLGVLGLCLLLNPTVYVRARTFFIFLMAGRNVFLFFSLQAFIHFLASSVLKKRGFVSWLCTLNNIQVSLVLVSACKYKKKKKEMMSEQNTLPRLTNTLTPT